MLIDIEPWKEKKKTTFYSGQAHTKGTVEVATNTNAKIKGFEGGVGVKRDGFSMTSEIKSIRSQEEMILQHSCPLRHEILSEVEHQSMTWITLFPR